MNCYQQQEKTKLRNAFSYNVSTDLKLSIAQVFKKIQSGGFLRIIIK